MDASATSAGKSYKFGILMWLMVFEILCKMEPQRELGLDPDSIISIVCMSRNANLAKLVTFRKILPFFDCPFFREYFPPSVDFEKMRDSIHRLPRELRFPKNVVIFPGTGSALSALGYDLISAGIDEANYLEVIEDSKKGVTAGDSKAQRIYNAGPEMFNTIHSRMVGRYVSAGGNIPGLLVVFSAPRFTDDFTSQMIAEAELTKDHRVMWRRRATWEAIPKYKLSGEYFDFDIDSLEVVNLEKYKPGLEKIRKGAEEHLTTKELQDVFIERLSNPI